MKFAIGKTKGFLKTFLKKILRISEIYQSTNFPKLVATKEAWRYHCESEYKTDIHTHRGKNTFQIAGANVHYSLGMIFTFEA